MFSILLTISCFCYVEISGYLCKQLLRYTKCDVCRNTIKNADSYSQEASAQLVNLKTRWGLIIRTKHSSISSLL